MMAMRSAVLLDFDIGDAQTAQTVVMHVDEAVACVEKGLHRRFDGDGVSRAVAGFDHHVGETDVFELGGFSCRGAEAVVDLQEHREGVLMV